MKIKELRRYRTYSDTNSINRHTVRVYTVNESFYMLERTTDANPPFFALYSLSAVYTNDSKLSELSVDDAPISVNGRLFWGDGLSWKKAEAMMFVELEKFK